MALLDLDKDVVERVSKKVEIDENIHKQIISQRQLLDNTSLDCNYVTLFYTVILANGVPDTCYFYTKVTREQMIRLNFDRPYYRHYAQMYLGGNLPLGNEVLDEIFDKVRDHFYTLTKGIDIKKIFVADHTPIQQKV